MHIDRLRRIASGDTAFYFTAPEDGLDVDDPYTVVRKDGHAVAIVHHPAYENWSERALTTDDKYIALYEKNDRVNFFCVTLHDSDDAWANLHPFEQEKLITETCAVIAKQFAEVHELKLLRVRGLASANLTTGSLVVYDDGEPSVRRKARGHKVLEVFVGNIPVLACEFQGRPTDFPVWRRWENPTVLKGDTDAVFRRLTRIFKNLYE